MWLTAGKVAMVLLGVADLTLDDDYPEPDGGMEVAEVMAVAAASAAVAGAATWCVVTRCLSDDVADSASTDPDVNPAEAADAEQDGNRTWWRLWDRDGSDEDGAAAAEPEAALVQTSEVPTAVPEEDEDWWRVWRRD